MVRNLDRVKYTLAHRKAFRRVERQLLGRNTLRGWLHDLDKVFLYPFFDYKSVHNWHREYSRHHAVKAHSHADYVQMVIDWECARFTKPDKPLDARGTLKKFYPGLESVVLPVIEELGL